MNQTQALVKATKLLGPKARLRINPKVPVGDARLAEVAKRKELNETLRAVKLERDARMAELLKADPEYQRLKDLATKTEKARDNLYDSLHYRVEILTNHGGWYNRVESQGDNFEDALDKLAKKKVKA